MEKTIVTTGKTIDEAIETALAQLGLDRDSVSVQVLAQAKAGFLGIGATPAKVQVAYEAPDEKPAAPKSALGSASRSKPKAAPAPKKEAAAPVAEAPKAEPKKEPKKEAVKPVKVAREPREYAPAAPGSIEEKIEVFLKGLLEHMNSQAVPHAWKENDNTYMVELVGDRGDTLDALQHLANYSINRGIEGHIRINVDAECYREKREESLRRYAQKKAQQVLKAHRRTTLEPMNAYERHVIHATLQEMEQITTYSIGSEPNRRVVIEFVR